jgi:hypothetical protein
VSPKIAKSPNNADLESLDAETLPDFSGAVARYSKVPPVNFLPVSIDFEESKISKHQDSKFVPNSHRSNVMETASIISRNPMSQSYHL